MILFRGKKKGIIHTRNISIDDIRAVFFPKNFYEKYLYLGSVPYQEKGQLFKAMEPLVIFMDYKAKPKYCPRFVLRFLHLFGNDNSIVRVRNWYLHRLYAKLSKCYMISDFKTKWTDYDLRISISGDGQCQDLARAIEHRFYSDGYREDLAAQIKELCPDSKFNSGYSISTLEKELAKLSNNK
jgi:hypothetical protein